MIKLVDNKLQADLLDCSKVLNSETIKNYNYIEFKNDLDIIYKLTN